MRGAARLSGVTAVAAGGWHNLALKSDGTVVGWGDNGAGQATPPAGLTDVVAIAAGFSYSLALKSDRTVVGWGDNFYGEATPPAGLTDVIAIAAGFLHSLALKSDAPSSAGAATSMGRPHRRPGCPELPRSPPASNTAWRLFRRVTSCLRC